MAATTAPATSPTTHPAPIDSKIMLNGQVVSYRAVADEMQLRDDAGKPTAKMFYVAYTRTTPAAATEPTSQPATAAATTRPRRRFGLAAPWRGRSGTSEAQARRLPANAAV